MTKNSSRFLAFSRLAAMLFASTLWSSVAMAQVKALPPKGIEIPEATKEKLKVRIAEINDELQRVADKTSDAADWSPDVLVLLRGVELAITQDLFYQPKDVDVANKLLDEAKRRVAAVQKGARGLALLLPDQAPELPDQAPEGTTGDAPRPVVGGFVSRLDDSVQPYGLVVPKNFQLGNDAPRRLDVWLHGRGDNKLELAFLQERMTKVGQYAPENTFVLHPFGRHCNAFKFAGETDVYEAIEHTSKLINVNDKLVSMRGFSMGGAGSWHFAVHDPARWFAVNPGAGFVDTIVYQGWQDKPPFAIDSTRARLLRWYDVLPWVTNLQNTNVIAYSGENDKQKQAANRVEAELKRLGLSMQHVVGAEMGHKINDVSAALIDEQLAQWASEATPSQRREIDFVTYTLRYPGTDWLKITGLYRHWEKGRIQARFQDEKLIVETDGITSFRLDFGPRADAIVNEGDRLRISIDGVNLRGQDQSTDPGFQCGFVRDSTWRKEEVTDAGREIDLGLRKRPGLQGPIDDAFCERFLFVVPSRPATHGPAQRWIDRELKYAQQRWATLMRGEVRVVQDTALTEEEIANANLICFGDFLSNRFLSRIAHQLPIQWDRERIQVGENTFDPSHHVVAMCFPNPANPSRYLVVNSGMTFRDFSNTSNSRQIAMLPDWAVLDVNREDDSIFAGGIVAEGFFNETWQLDQ